MTADELAVEVGKAAGQEMAKALERIKHCLGQLTDEQIWHRPRPEMNSIGNLLLHLCGNVRQWLVAGLGTAADTRKRYEEFSAPGPIPRADLVRQLEMVVAEAQAVLVRQTAEQLVAVRRIQSYDVTGLAALFDSVPHFRGHTQEIVGMTRLLLGAAYRFAWTPATREEGAAV